MSEMHFLVVVGLLSLAGWAGTGQSARANPDVAATGTGQMPTDTDMAKSVFDVRGFGAVGDGVTMDTQSLQRAIDACAAAGGGRVTVPAGVFLTGTIFLKSHVELHLMMGATLRGSPNRCDYNADDLFPQNQVFVQENNVTGAHLILALEQEDVAITGEGTIDGNSDCFFDPPTEPDGKAPVPHWRPGQMVYFVECQSVRVRDVRLLNAPYWTLFLHGCVNAQIRGLRIDNPRSTHNGDGIDLDCCKNVTVSDCIIRVGDDCITLRANSARLKDPTKACENITVTNCVLSTFWNAVRVGVGDGTVRNCVFSNLVITNTKTGICLIGNYTDSSAQGTEMRSIRFSNITMETEMPFYIFTGRKASRAIRDITFSDIRGSGSKASVVRGTPGRRPAGIRFRNIELDITGGSKTIANPADLPKLCWEWDKGQPAAFYCAHVDDVLFDNVILRWGACDGPWRHALLAEDATGLVTRDCQFPPPPTSQESAAAPK